MNKSYIPTCYFPSTVLFVDDSKDFLLNFSLQLDEKLAYRLFDSPFEALKTIHNVHQSDELYQKCISEELQTNGYPLTTHTINLDLAAIHWEVYNPQRFSEISVIVADYAMPGMDGLEFCKRMENSPIKKILLTGRADEKIAVKAFNDGIIDHFIRKNDPEVKALINENIQRLQLRYFQEMSDLIVKMLSVSAPTCLADASFADFFKKLCAENNIVEYYLTESSGSYLLLDASGNTSCLIVKTQQDLKMHYDLAVDNNAPQTVLEQLKSGEKIPYFWQSGGINKTEWSDWSTYLYPAEQFHGHEIYYYALIKKPFSFDIQPQKILSYSDYLEHVDNEGYPGGLSGIRL